MMNWLDKIIRGLVGGLFIFSGLIKLNDPRGTEIKLEEYFEVFSTDFAHFFELLIPAAMPIGLFLVIFEIVLGIAVAVVLAILGMVGISTYSCLIPTPLCM